MNSQRTSSTPEVCLCEKSVTLFRCAHCEAEFEPTNQRQRFCSGACRVAAHRALGKALTLAQRNTRTYRLNRDRALSLRGCSGTIASNVPLAADIKHPVWIPSDETSLSTWHAAVSR